MTKAAFDARNLLDFAEGGSLTKSAKGPAAFFGSQLQGLRRESNALNAFKDPKYAAKTVLKGMIYLTIPTILNFLRNEEDPEYLNASQVRRDTMWFVRLPESMGGKAVWLPKPPGILGYGFTVPVERAMMAFRKEDPEAFKSFWQGVVTHIPNPVPTAGRWPFEAVSNYSVYQGRPVVPEHLQEKPAEYQFTPETSLTSRKLAGAVKKVKDVAGVQGNLPGSAGHIDSPIMLDYILDSVFGTLGRTARKGANVGRDELSWLIESMGGNPIAGMDFGGIDAIFTGMRGEDEAVRPEQSVMSRFQVDPARYGDEVLNRFYKKAAYLNTESEREKLGEESQADTSELKGMEKAKKKITALRREMEAESDPEAIAMIRQDIVDIASDWVDLPKGAEQAPKRRVAGVASR
jgi:hypothetical protein